jgi:HSP20 family protein
MELNFNFQDAAQKSSTGFSSYEEPQYLVPEVDILEDEAGVYYIYELPGIKTEELNVELSEEAVFVAAVSDKKDKQILHQERALGTFFRRLPLPDSVDVNSAQADFNNGLLEISFVKTNNY